MLFWLLLPIALLSSITGITAEIPLYAKTGDSVQLDVPTQEIQDFDYFSWINEKAKNVVGYTNGGKVKLDPSYQNRTNFSITTFSLTLINLQKTDSGLYTSRKGFPDKDIIKYRVSVIDEVEPPLLDKDSNLFSPELCSFTCSGHDLNVSSIYNSSSCFEENVTSADNHTLKVNCNDTFIMCNYSNPVSWKTETKEINKVCTVTQEILSYNSGHPSWSIALYFLLALSLLVFVLVKVFCVYKRKKDAYKPSDVEHTFYDAVGEKSKPQTTHETLENLKITHTVYDTVREHGVPVTTETQSTSPQNDPPNQNISPTEKSKSDGPITIYSTLDQPTKVETDHTIYAAVSKRYA